MKIMKCIACNSDNILKYFGRVEKYTYYECSNCSTIQLVPIPLKEDIDRAYETSYSKSGHHADTCDVSHPRNKIVFEIIKDNLNRKGYGTVVDYGCGTGCLLELLENDNIQYIGLDLSNENVNVCRKKGLNAYKDDIDYFDNGNNDIKNEYKSNISIIVMIAVFEHLTNHDEFIDKCKRLLKDDGLLVILSPTAYFAKKIGKIGKNDKDLPLTKSHNIFCPPWHTTLFSIDGIRKMMKRHGFVVKSVLVSPPGNKSKWKDKIIRRIFTLINSIGFELNERCNTVVSHIFLIEKETI